MTDTVMEERMMRTMLCTAEMLLTVTEEGDEGIETGESGDNVPLSSSVSASQYSSLPLASSSSTFEAVSRKSSRR